MSLDSFSRETEGCTAATVPTLDGIEVSECEMDPSMFVGHVRQITDDEREQLIAAYGRRIETCMVVWNAAGCFAARGEADYWRGLMEESIKARSPAQVARMERERGLA